MTVMMIAELDIVDALAKCGGPLLVCRRRSAASDLFRIQEVHSQIDMARDCTHNVL